MGNDKEENGNGISTGIIERLANGNILGCDRKSRQG